MIKCNMGKRQTYFATHLRSSSWKTIMHQIVAFFPLQTKTERKQLLPSIVSICHVFISKKEITIISPVRLSLQERKTQNSKYDIQETKVMSWLISSITNKIGENFFIPEYQTWNMRNNKVNTLQQWKRFSIVWGQSSASRSSLRRSIDHSILQQYNSS